MYNTIERRERPAWIGDKCKDCIYRCEECERHYNRAPETHMKNHSLCWCCKNSTNGMCEYMATGMPYEDSEYFTKTLKNGDVNINIRTCSHFERG